MLHKLDEAIAYNSVPAVRMLLLLRRIMMKRLTVMTISDLSKLQMFLYQCHVLFLSVCCLFLSDVMDSEAISCFNMLKQT